MNKRLIFYYPKLFIRFLLSPLYFSRVFLNDLKAFFGIYSYSYKYIFIAGYPKSGTTWVENFISRIPGYNPRVLFGDADILRRHDLPVDTFSKIPSFGYSAIKTHIFPSMDNINILLDNGISKVVVMYRDPRDIIVSNYYHVLSSNPWRITDQEYLDYSTVTKSQALTHSMKLTLSEFCPWVQGWYDVHNSNLDIECFFIKYEDLKSNPRQIFSELLLFYNITFDNSIFDTLFDSTTNLSTATDKPTGYEPGKKSTFRKGLTGTWKQELDPTHISFINDTIHECLVFLGYEKN